MRDIPIIFSAPMVRALLDGRKTQTRRILKPQPPSERDFPGSVFGLSPAVADGVKMYSLNDYERMPKHPTKWDLVGSVGVARDAGFPLTHNARYAVGDRLWVRETIELRELAGNSFLSPVYAADGAHVMDGVHKASNHEFVKRRITPSGHMPRWASRLTLIVEGVKVERLQDITTAGAIAEGVIDDEWREWREDAGNIGMPEGSHIEDERDVFAKQWNTKSGAHAWDGPGSWEANPWVVAISFRVERANIDALKVAA